MYNKISLLKYANLTVYESFVVSNKKLLQSYKPVVVVSGGCKQHFRRKLRIYTKIRGF